MTCRLSAPATLARDRSLADTVTGGDALGVGVGIDRALGDAFATADQVGRTVGLHASLSDASALSDAVGPTLIAGGGGLILPNISSLPATTSPGYQPVSAAAYAALTMYNPDGTVWGTNPRLAPAGTWYRDPVTNVKVWKATSSTSPHPTAGANWWTHDYAEGGNECSLPWGNGRQYTLHTVGYPTLQHWLVDFELGVGLIGTPRQLHRSPGSDTNFSFSNNPLTPRIAYLRSGSAIYRVNTATVPTVDAPLGVFPKTGLSFTPGPVWLKHDRFDRWFSWNGPQVGGDYTPTMWDSVANVVYTTPNGYNEIRMLPDGDYALLLGEPDSHFWRTSDREISAAMLFGGRRTPVHGASLRGRVLAHDVDSASSPDMYRGTPGGWPAGVYTNISAEFAGYAYHGSGNWIQDDAVLPGGDLNKQWAMFASYGLGGRYGGAVSAASHPLQNAIGFIRADGSERRQLCHTYSLSTNSALDHYWTEISLAKQAPDGKLVQFHSCMQQAGGRADLWIAEVPLGPGPTV